MIAFEGDDNGRIRIELYGERSTVEDVATAQIVLAHYFGCHLGVANVYPGCPICPRVRAALAGGNQNGRL